MTIKKCAALLLCMMLLLSVFSGCAKKPGPEELKQQEEDQTLKLITIGNSHTNGINHLLFDVFKAEKPEQKVVVGYLYYSGCSVELHVTHSKYNMKVYDYRVNSDGQWIETEATMEDGLTDQQWDIIVLHEMNTKGSIEATYRNDNLSKLMTYVDSKVTTPHKYVWNMSWANPVDGTFFTPDYQPQPPENWSIVDYDLMYSRLVSCTRTFIEPMEQITDIFPTGTVIQYANNVLGMSDLDLYRDYTHMSDLGRLMCAYLWYAKLTGLTEITEVNTDVIPAAMRHTRAQKLGDLEITGEMKQQIIQSVNHALKCPYELPAPLT